MLVDYFLILFMLRQCMFSVCHVLPRKPCFSRLLSSSRSARQDTPCLSLSTRLMSSPMPLLPHCLPSQPLPCSAQKEVRQRARGFCARFATFCRAFQNTFYPMLAHFSTLSMAGFLPGGWVGLDGTQQLCTAPWYRLKAKTDASKLSANE